MKIGMPKQINMQIALLLLVCVALFHAAATAILLFSSPGPADPRNVFATTEATALASLNSASASERSKIVAALNDSVPELALALSAPIGNVAHRDLELQLSQSPPSVRHGNRHCQRGNRGEACRDAARWSKSLSFSNGASSEFWENGASNDRFRRP